MGTSISFVSIFWRVLIIFSLSIFGAAARKAGWLKDEARESIANIIMNISLPALIFGKRPWHLFVDVFIGSCDQSPYLLECEVELELVHA